jgi:type III pantothenate kinase
MVAVVDIGNTNLHCGVYQGERLCVRVVHPHDTPGIEEKIESSLHKKEIEGIAIGSVVPALTRRFVRLFSHLASVKPYLISIRSNHPLQILYRTPHTLGVDRLAHCVGAFERYHRDVIVLSIGTAITMDVILGDGSFLGGVIAPGMDMSMHALTHKTAQLTSVPLRKPRKYIGKSTTECLQSGIVNGTIAMLNSMIGEIKRECKKKFLVVATGGGSSTIVNYLAFPARCDQTLSLYGILKLYHYNVLRNKPE